MWELSFGSERQPGLLLQLIDGGRLRFTVLSLTTGRIEIADVARWTERHLDHLVGRRLL